MRECGVLCGFFGFVPEMSLLHVKWKVIDRDYSLRKRDHST